MNFTDIVSFFLYVIPGFISNEIYRSKYPGKKDSDFSRITWSIVISIFLIVAAKWIDEWFRWRLFPTKATFPEFSTIAVLMFLAFLLAYLRIAKRILVEKYQLLLEEKYQKQVARTRAHAEDHQKLPEKKSPWLKFFSEKPLPIWPLVNNVSVPQWACVTLTDGSKYIGWIKDWTYDPNDTEQDFLLSNAQKIDQEFNTIYEIDGLGIYLRTSRVICIEFFKGEANREEVNKEEITSQKEAAPVGDNE